MKNNTKDSASFEKLSWKTRLSYGCGDTACNIVMAGMVNSLLTLFYSDYAGIPIATIGLVMLISRFFDGSSDVIMGILVEKTKSKFGKARPWILWMSIPYVLLLYLLFHILRQIFKLSIFLLLIIYSLQYVILQLMFHMELYQH